MIIATDLDDTLYPEIEYVHSGFRQVCDYLQLTFDLEASECYKFMLDELKLNGRGKIFDSVLNNYKLNTESNRKKCISIYRTHKPTLELYPEAVRFLNRFSGYRKYLITDGNIRVQRNKISALQLHQHFQKTIPTYQYGMQYSKPSLYCFEKILAWERETNPNQLIYIGDNPKKDFVSLNEIGAKTIRVLTGEYKDTKADKGYDAQYTVNTLDEITEEFIKSLAR